MALELPYGYKNLNPEGSSNVDESYGYYNSIAEALQEVPLAMRKGGRTVGIKQADGKIVEYWWENDNDLSDSGLVQKNVGGGGGGGDAVWGSISGTIANQADLMAEFDKKVDKADLEIGGRNYLKKSNSLDSILIAHSESSLSVSRVGDYFKVTTTGGSSTIKIRIDQNLQEPLSEYYTCSFHVKNNKGIPFEVIMRGISTQGHIIPGNFEGKVVFTRLKNTTGTILFYFLSDAVGDDLDFEITPIKLEKGNVATDWTPAPEDKEDAFEKNTAFNKDFGTTAGTVAEGNDSRLSDAREWTASTVSQAEAEAGTSATRRAWTALRVRQAISGWWDSIGTTFGKGFISLANATQAREKLALGDSATKNVGQTNNTVMEGDDDRIVDGGVVRESILLTSEDNIDDIITPGHYHTFEGDVVNEFPTEYGGAMKVVTSGNDGEIFQIVYDVDGSLLSRGYFQGSFTDWNTYAPTHWVNNNFAKLSDIYKENAVLDGDWFLKPNTEDTYNVIAREYIINKVLYTDTITGEVTRAPRHATLRRWDMITVESDHTFLITSGVPALDPTRPIPNKQQAVLTYIFVSAIADAPAEPDFLLLYDENVGEPAESEVTTGAPSIVTLDSTEAPFQGTKHILFNERVSDTVDEAVVFTFTTLQNLNNFGKLIMHMATSKGGAANNHFLIHVKNGNTTIASFSSVAISWSPTGVGNWERGVLDMVEYANLPNDEFDKIVIDASNGPGWNGYIQQGSKLDYIFLTEKDDTTPVNPVVIQRTSDIPINDGATGVSRYAEMRDIEKPDIILSANTVLNANWNGRDVITSHTITVNPNTQDYEDSFEVYLYNNSATDSAIVLTAKTGVTYTVIDNTVSSSTVFLQAYGTAVIKRIGGTQNYIIRGYII